MISEPFPPDPGDTPVSRADRMRLFLVEMGIRFPWLCIGVILVVTACFLWQFPKVRFDNDPENMLPADEPVRVFHQTVKARYALYDFVIVGVVNDRHPDGN